MVVDNGADAPRRGCASSLTYAQPARGVRGQQRRRSSARRSPARTLVDGRRRHDAAAGNRLVPTRSPDQPRPAATRCRTSTARTSATGSGCSRTQPINIVARRRPRRRASPAAPLQRARRAHRERRPRARRDRRRQRERLRPSHGDRRRRRRSRTTASILVAPGIKVAEPAQPTSSCRSTPSYTAALDRRAAVDARAADQPHEPDAADRGPGPELHDDRAPHAAAEPRDGGAPEASASRSCKRDHDRHRRLQPDQRAPHRRLRQGRRSARLRTRTSASSTTSRVRAALKATLDGFLSQMVLDEMLVGLRARR